MPKQSRNKATMESYFGKAAMARQDERYKSVVPISPDQKKSIQDRELKEAADRSRVMTNRAKFTGKAEGNYEIEYRRLREQGVSAEVAQAAASRVAASRAATAKGQDITHATFDVNKGGMQKAQAKPGMSNSEVIAAAQARLASGTRTPEDAKWDRKLIQASRDRMKIAGETESVPADISDRQLGFVRRKGQFISKPTDEDIGHSRRAEEMRTQLALSQQRIDATPPAPTRAPTFIPPPIMGSESRLEANTAKVAASTASAETVMSGRTKLENQIQKAIANPDRSKLPADPFQGFHGEHPATSSLTGKVPEKVLMKGGKPMTDKQKEGLAKAHAAIRARSAAKKEAALGGQKKMFDAIRGGGSFEAMHPRVPSGNSKGGQWTKK